MKNHEVRLIYFLPTMMTAGNLIFGFLAILQILEGAMVMQQSSGTEWLHYYERSLLFILGAFICDSLDGRLARLGGQESAFGRELDSLADIVSFGVAPALLLFKIVLAELPERLGWIIACTYLAFGAFRLARFNVLASDPESGGQLKDFTGFPIPAAAALIASITLALLNFYAEERNLGYWKYALAGLMVFLSFMMFSRFKYPSFKSLDWKSRRPLPKILAAVVLLSAIAVTYRYSLAVVFTAYLLYGFFRPYVAKRWRPEPPEEAEED
ncbi:MAG: CDP-diacylglycerol--serine O-phosphatidyltransferase [Candidatus Methylacidiphilales bacterium]